jgi:hypothetical protein
MPGGLKLSPPRICTSITENGGSLTSASASRSSVCNNWGYLARAGADSTSIAPKLIGSQSSTVTLQLLQRSRSSALAPGAGYTPQTLHKLDLGYPRLILPGATSTLGTSTDPKTEAWLGSRVSSTITLRTSAAPRPGPWLVQAEPRCLLHTRRLYRSESRASAPWMLLLPRHEPQHLGRSFG